MRNSNGVRQGLFIYLDEFIYETIIKGKQKIPTEIERNWSGQVLHGMNK